MSYVVKKLLNKIRNGGCVEYNRRVGVIAFAHIPGLPGYIFRLQIKTCVKMAAVLETTGVYCNVQKNFSCSDSFLSIKRLYYKPYR